MMSPAMAPLKFGCGSKSLLRVRPDLVGRSCHRSWPMKHCPAILLFHVAHGCNSNRRPPASRAPGASGGDDASRTSLEAGLPHPFLHAAPVLTRYLPAAPLARLNWHLELWPTKAASSQCLTISKAGNGSPGFCPTFVAIRALRGARPPSA